MSKLVLITGPQAVGKMTVGQELVKITNLKLFHNHMSIDLVSNFFSYGTEIGRNLVTKIRMEILEAVAKSDSEGIIFTVVMAYDCKEDVEQMEKMKNLFKENNGEVYYINGEVYYIELQAPLEIRMERNKTENRKKHKPSKRNEEFSERLLLRSDIAFRTESEEGEVTEKNYLKIDNTNISAKEVAKMIKEKFNL